MHVFRQCDVHAWTQTNLTLVTLAPLGPSFPSSLPPPFRSGWEDGDIRFQRQKAISLVSYLSTSSHPAHVLAMSSPNPGPTT